MLSGNIARNMKRLRRLNKLTQEKLSQMTCVPRVCIARYETGSTVPRLGAMSKIAKALGVSLDQLISDDADVEDGSKN